jgi:hypothetical protein
MGLSICTIPVYENNGKASKVVVPSTVATAALVASLADAIKGSSTILGMVGVGKFSTSAGNTPSTDLKAAPVGAQRGQRLLVRGTCTSTKVVHTLEIPCASNTAIIAQGSDAATVPSGIVSALNALWTDSSGNAIVVSATGSIVNRNVN